jgi:dolichol-phosphate mannosyltransferase
LLIPFQKFNAEVVYGSRFRTSEINRVLFFWHSLANKFITLTSNLFSDLNLTDVETDYKVFRKDLIKNINIEEKRFG